MRPDRKAGMLNFNINPRSIIDASNRAVSFDPNDLLRAGIEGINKKLVEDDDMNKLKIKSEYDRVHSEYTKRLNDPLVYRDQEILNNTKTEYEKRLGEIDKLMAETELTSRSRTQLEEYNKTSKSSVDVSTELMETKQKFNEQQASINAQISEDADSTLASSFDGIAGLSQMNLKLNSLDETLLSQVSAKNMSELDAKGLFTETLAKSSLTSAVTISMKQITNSGLAPEQKLIQLNNLIKHFGNRETLDNMSKEVSDGYKNTSKDSLEVELNKQAESVLSLIRKEMNGISTDMALRKQLEGTKKEKFLDIADTEEYNSLKSRGLHWEAYKFKQDKLKLPAEYNKVQFLAMNAEEFFGKPLELANPEQREVPLQQLNSFTAKQLVDLNANLFAELEIPSGTSQNDAFDLGMNKMIEVTATDLGLDPTIPEHRVASVKFLAGQNIGSGFIAPDGEIDYDLAMAIAVPEYSKISPSKQETNKSKIMDSFHTKINLQAIEQVKSIPRNTVKRTSDTNSAIVLNNSRGIFMPENAVTGKSGTIIDNQFKGNLSFSGKNKVDSITFQAVDKIIGDNNINFGKMSKERLNMKAKVIDTIKSSDAYKTRIEAEALAIFQRKQPDFYKDGNYLKGVKYQDLVDTNSIDEAIYRVAEDILAGDENFNKYFKESSVPFYNQPRKLIK